MPALLTLIVAGLIATYTGSVGASAKAMLAFYKKNAAADELLAHFTPTICAVNAGGIMMKKPGCNSAAPAAFDVFDGKLIRSANLYLPKNGKTISGRTVRFVCVDPLHYVLQEKKGASSWIDVAQVDCARIMRGSR